MIWYIGRAATWNNTISNKQEWSSQYPLYGEVQQFTGLSGSPGRVNKVMIPIKNLNKLYRLQETIICTNFNPSIWNLGGIVWMNVFLHWLSLFVLLKCWVEVMVVIQRCQFVPHSVDEWGICKPFCTVHQNTLVENFQLRCTPESNKHESYMLKFITAIGKQGSSNKTNIFDDH